MRSGTQVSPLVARTYRDQVLPEVSLEFLNGPSRSARWPMNRVMSLVGSAYGCKFRLADPSVSSFHCSLLRTHAGLWVIDLLGPDGIGVNDAPVRFALLAPNDVLSVGRYRIRMRIRYSGLESEGAGFVEKRPASVPVSHSSTQVALTPGLSGSVSASLATVSATQWRVLDAGFSAPGSLGRQPTGGDALVAAGAQPHLDRGEITESLLVPLLNQFGQMQQQMLDQFQQAISLIVQMFGTLHRDQMVTIREELDQLRDLTREFHSIKLELAARLQDQTSLVAADTRVATDALANSEMALTAMKRSESPDHDLVNQVGTQATPSLDSIEKLASVVDQLKVATFSQAPLAAPSAAPKDVQEPQVRSSQSNPESDRDVIVWLHQRMAVLQQERESRWRKILKLLPGVS